MGGAAVAWHGAAVIWFGGIVESGRCIMRPADAHIYFKHEGARREKDTVVDPDRLRRLCVPSSPSSN